MKNTSLVLLSLLISVAVSAQTWTSDKAHANLGFTITHLMVSDVEGQFKSFDAKITSSAADFSDAVFELTADTKSVTTFNDMRDGHLQKPEMFDTEHFPTMTFKSTSIAKAGDKKYKLNGNLTLKGVTKPVSLDLTLIGVTENPMSKKSVAGFRVSGTVKRSDFNIATGMPTAVITDEVSLRASGEFVKG
jgi:polyisoprenoid-binding protein YceI